ncbi:hypothetical protein PR048_023729 [Dryococelus australis]|uniref:Uncharacterized protein n=1 Tax=Dryococelus australis TaxID=614101 RepID=A0ABQ9GUZ6_9NEOP|nr:hypothetical protein PR048_023729 [Dryococelus australis]
MELRRNERAGQAGEPRGEPGSTPDRVTPGCSYVGILPDDTAGRWVFSGFSRLPTFPHSHLLSPLSAPKTSLCSGFDYSPPTKANRSSIYDRVTPGFSQVVIVLDEAVGRRVFSGISQVGRHTPRGSDSRRVATTWQQYGSAGSRGFQSSSSSTDWEQGGSWESVSDMARSLAVLEKEVGGRGASKEITVKVFREGNISIKLAGAAFSEVGKAGEVGNISPRGRGKYARIPEHQLDLTRINFSSPHVRGTTSGTDESRTN